MATGGFSQHPYLGRAGGQFTLFACRLELSPGPVKIQGIWAGLKERECAALPSNIIRAIQKLLCLLQLQIPHS